MQTPVRLGVIFLINLFFFYDFDEVVVQEHIKKVGLNLPANSMKRCGLHLFTGSLLLQSVQWYRFTVLVVWWKFTILQVRKSQVYRKSGWVGWRVYGFSGGRSIRKWNRQLR